MSQYQMDGTQHVTGEAALWQELCKMNEENERLRALLLDLIRAIIKERCMYPEIGSVVDKARKELEE